MIQSARDYFIPCFLGWMFSSLYFHVCVPPMWQALVVVSIRISIFITEAFSYYRVKLSKYGVLCGPFLLHSDWIRRFTEYICVQSEYRTEKIPDNEHFSCNAVYLEYKIQKNPWTMSALENILKYFITVINSSAECRTSIKEKCARKIKSQPGSYTFHVNLRLWSCWDLFK